jgi:hypothetical protein
MGQKHEQEAGFSRLWLSIITLVILVGASAGLAYHFSRKPASNPKSSASQKPVTPTTSKAQGADNNSMLSIAELGVKFQVPQTLDGLSYTVTTARGPQGDLVTVQMIIKSYSDLADKCAGVSGNTSHPFANLSKASGSASNQPADSVIKRLNGFTILNSGSSVPPNITCKNGVTQKQLTSLDEQLVNSLKSAFKNAQQI